MFGSPRYSLKNPLLDGLIKHGWEEIIGPLGPMREARMADPSPEPWRLAPEPDPWRVAVPQLFRAVQARDLASRLKGEAGESLARSSAEAIDSILDDWCGTRPRFIPWPYPGPPPWVWEIASELSLIANTLQPGSLREGLLDVAARAAQNTTVAR